jgi:hypothetical protein
VGVKVTSSRSTEPLIKKNTSIKKISDTPPSLQKATDSDLRFAAALRYRNLTDIIQHLPS